ncbi:MAG: 23S rRNA (pseudouridine(1915)-N(3))-methyltransferase RlmH [Candidatus Falkowbacteria bacterium]
MLNITLVTVGKIKEAYLSEAATSYIKRIKPYGRLNILEVKAESFSTATKDKAKNNEALKIQAILDNKREAQIYLMSEHGTLFNSLEFATKIENPQEIVLVIAGSLGFAKELEAKYPKISLSPLTFPHELARVILLEQIYRAATIINHKEYHY